MNTSVKVHSGFTVQHIAFKVNPPEISLSSAHIPVSSQPHFLSGAWLELQHHAINVGDFGVSSHMLKWFYRALFLPLACPSLFSCTCPFWEGTHLLITGCRNLGLIHLLKVTLPQRVWASTEVRVLKRWVSGCGSAPRCGAVGSTSTPHWSLWWGFPGTRWEKLRIRDLF